MAEVTHESIEEAIKGYTEPHLDTDLVTAKCIDGIQVNGDKVNLIAGVTKDLTGSCRAGDLVKLAAEKVGGKGGGRPDMAQAGGSDPSGVDDALGLVEPWVREQL